jgi:TonB family protein
MDPNFRRNMVGALIAHGALIAGLVVWETFTPKNSEEIVVEMITPAALLGDLPVGPGRGTGAHRAPEPVAAPLPTQPAGGADDEREAPAPAPATVARTVAQPISRPVPIAPNDVAIPTKTNVRPTPVRTTATNTGTTTSRRTQTGASSATTKTAKTTGGTRGASADDFRKRFASALGSSEGGSALGDGRPAGGGDGSKKYGRLGHPDGTADGVVGGLGKGSPNWQYFLHVHDRMYDAWEKPNELLDKNLKATVLLEIAPDGTINDVRLKRSSGNKVMDDTAMAAARRVPRLNPPPSSLLKGAEAPVTVDFELEG